MAHGLHLISNTLPGYGQSEGRCLLCSRTSGGTISSYSSQANFCPSIKVAVTGRSVYGSKRTHPICSVNSNNHRRNPDFLRQNRHNHSVSRNKNRPNMERERSENFEESEYTPSKNGPLLSFSNSTKYQATATPGPREKEIVELFRKVQAQLRARAAVKEEKKINTSQGQGKETETVDSLLKLLRKHSGDQGKRRHGSASVDFGIDQSEHNSSFEEEHNTSFFDSNANSKEEAQESNTSSFRRPTSNFRRRSPVPRVKYQPVYSVEENDTSNPLLNPQVRKKKGSGESISVYETELGDQPDTETEQDPDLEPYVAASDVRDEDDDEESDDDDEEFDVMSESESEDEVETEADVVAEAVLESELEFSDIDEAHNDNAGETHPLNQQADLSALKLPELRALAKLRGLKGSYKLKKGELVALLTGDSG